MHQLTQLFATAIYQSRIDMQPAVRQLIRSQPFKRFTGDTGSCTESVQLLALPQLQQLQAEIMRHVEFYCRDELAVADHVEFYMTNSWCTRHQQGDHSPRHNHSNSLISGVLYIDCDSQSGQLQFFKDWGLTNLWPSAVDLDCARFNEINSKFWTIQPQVGDLILFPSHLAHGVTVSQSLNDRHCLAFNLFARGVIGTASDPQITTLTLK